MLRSAFSLLCVTVCSSACAPRSDAAADEQLPPLVVAVAPPGPIVGEIGTADPLTIQGVAPTGHWVAICQARADTDGDRRIQVSIGEHGDLYGDEMRAYLVRAAGPGEPIDAFVGSDPSGRHVAVVKEGGRLALLDTWKGGELALPRADPTDDPNPSGPHRAVSFDAGHHAAWAERTDGGWRIVVHDLDDGSEQRIAIGSSVLWRFELDSTGRWLWIWTVEKDTDANGKLEIPRARTSLGDRFCRGEVAISGNYGWHGDQAIRSVAHVEDGAVATSAEGAIGVLGESLLVRMPDESIVRRDDDGEHVLVPATCRARIVHADQPSKTLWVVCTSQAHQELNWSYAPLHRYGFATHEQYELTLHVESQDAWTAEGPLLYTAEKVFVNPTTGTVGRPIGDSKHLFLRDAVLYDASPRHIVPTDLPEPDEVRGWPLADATSGEMLLPERKASYGTAIHGPLHWQPPASSRLR